MTGIEDEYTYLTYFNGTIKNINSTTIEHLSPLVEDENQKKLSNAFASLGNSYVFDYNDGDYDYKVYFTGRSIYLQTEFDVEEPGYGDLWFNDFTYEVGTLYSLYYDYGSWCDDYSLDGTYDELDSNISSLSGVLFDYDNGTYTSKEGYGSIIAENIIFKAKENDVLYYYDFTVSITLTNEDKLDTIIMTSEYITITIKVSEYTSLPFGLVDESIEG